MKLNKTQILILIIAAVISLVSYVIISASVLKIGFPLDDAWIHQVFARNLVQKGQWSFNADKITSGSTSPLWTLLLSAGFVIRLSPFIWTFFLCGALLFTTGYLSEGIIRKIIPNFSPKIPWIGILITFEWHIAWAAGSGMEILASTTLYLLLFLFLMHEKRSWWLIGGLIGISIWLRPEGVTWIAPAIFAMLFEKRPGKEFWLSITKLFCALFFIVFFYGLFNFLLSGTLFPNTFYAKQMEYSIILEQPIWTRLVNMFLLPLNGVGVLLFPGMIYFIGRACKEKDFRKLSMIVWFLGFIILYAILLPATYQHGRYIIPAMPAFLIMGVAGFIEITFVIKANRISRVFMSVWKYSIVIILIIYFILGGFTYARDVAIIETEMVTVAKWIARETPVDAVIAAHDIGAIGYYSERFIVDMAGLINPEVIPFIRNERKLSLYLDERNVDYLITFPDWYPELISGKEVLYETGSSFSILAGHSNMIVFKWK